MAAYPRHAPVVIIGGGPTGLTTANLLATYGVQPLVLEREPAPLDLPRAIVLDDEGMRVMQVFGMHRSYLPHTLEGVGSKYYDDDSACFAETGAGPSTYGFAKRMFIYQPEFEAALRIRLEEQAPDALRFASDVTRIEQDEARARVHISDASGETHVIETQWVLACDGGRSPTRESLDIPMVGHTYEQDWIVVDTLNDPDSSRFSKFFCSTARPHVSVPAPNGGRRYEFMLLPGETRDAVLEDAFLERLVAPLRPYRPQDFVRRTVYTFHARMAERFREGRILLLGDAAHLTPPFAGQGMNAGLRDAQNVAWKVAAALSGASSDILDSYETERRAPAWSMIQLAVAMGNIVMPSDAEQSAFRDLLMKALEPFPAVRDYLIQMRFKPRPRYDAGLFLDLGQPDFEASLVGEMIPQPHQAAGGGRLDDLLGAGFALIAQDDAGADALAGLDQREICGFPLASVRIDAARGASAGRASHVDPEVGRPLRTHRDQVLLVRPDRYCAAAFAPGNLPSGLARYESLLRASS